MKVYVGNISRHISDAQFHALALPFGDAEGVSVPRDAESGRTKGYGFLDFANPVPPKADPTLEEKRVRHATGTQNRTADSE